MDTSADNIKVKMLLTCKLCGQDHKAGVSVDFNRQSMDYTCATYKTVLSDVVLSDMEVIAIKIELAFHEMGYF